MTGNTRMDSQLEINRISRINTKVEVMKSNTLDIVRNAQLTITLKELKEITSCIIVHIQLSEKGRGRGKP
jgi:hypothetical protein